ncbi:MAG: hypothetical protein ACYCZN_13270 [Candidatus Dormibacteria bacterium]
MADQTEIEAFVARVTEVADEWTITYKAALSAYEEALPTPMTAEASKELCNRKLEPRDLFGEYSPLDDLRDHYVVVREAAFRVFRIEGRLETTRDPEGLAALMMEWQKLGSAVSNPVAH